MDIGVFAHIADEVADGERGLGGGVEAEVKYGKLGAVFSRGWNGWWWCIWIIMGGWGVQSEGSRGKKRQGVFRCRWRQLVVAFGVGEVTS